jgi:malto-oligosyltrehalose trehalohydrolase
VVKTKVDQPTKEEAVANSTSQTIGNVRVHEMRFGACTRNGSTTFNVWAPSATSLKLCLYGQNGNGDERILDMQRSDDGWWSRTMDGITAGQRYHYIVDELRVPDPASRLQADSVHGPSVVVQPDSFRWTDSSWHGKPWEQTVLYELHVGTFTREGTFRGVIEKLDYLKELGVTAIELMPLSEFPGVRNWGYDGVLHFAPANSYGSPEDLKALVNACHERDLMIFLDVVYNHFGPEGNYLHVLSKPFFTEKYKTPWGAAIDFEGPHATTVRSFFVENALYWLNEFHFDGLRFDAVHAIYDESEKKFLEQLSEAIHAGVNSDRHVHLVLENDDNNAHLLKRDPDGSARFFDAQWNDDYHHCVHVLATGEKGGYYADYVGGTSHATELEHFARVLAEGFAYQGDPSQYRNGERRGQKSAHLPATAFVSFMQNHDQVGNRAFGDRIASITTPEKLRAMTAITLLAPQIPMLFMGEEWASETPFQFFCDFGPDLAPLVAQGRREEFAKFPEFQDEKTREKIPDPTAEQTYDRCVLDWSERESENKSNHLNFVRTLLEIRSRELVPRLRKISAGARWQKISDNAIQVRWQLGDEELILTANLGDSPAMVKLEDATTIFSTHSTQSASPELSPWCVIWQIKQNAKQG